MTDKQLSAVDSGASLMLIINRAATDPAFDIAKLESLLAVKERWEKEEARKAFVVALSDFKADPPQVMKEKSVDFGNTHYKHAVLGSASAIIGASLSKHGLAHRWSYNQDKPGVLKVTCTLTHALGHSESVSLEGPHDSSGSKNGIQSIGSASSYLERYTLFAVSGIAAQDQDDDGLDASPRRNIKGPEEAPEGWIDHTAPHKKEHAKDVQVVDPISFQVLKVSKQKTTPVQFKIETTEGEVMFTLVESVALGAKTAVEIRAHCRAMVTNKAGTTWIDSLDVAAPQKQAEAF